MLVWVRLVGLYSISTVVGYLMPNPLYTCISNIYEVWIHFVDNIFKQAWGHYFAHS